MPQYTIFNVSDCPQTQKTLTLVLERAGFNVVETKTPSEAVEKMDYYKVDAIFIESQFQAYDSIELLEQITRHQPLTGIPKLLLANQLNPDFKNRGHEAGVTSWIIKPFHPDNLIRGLYKVLKKPSQSTTTVRKVG